MITSGRQSGRRTCSDAYLLCSSVSSPQSCSVNRSKWHITCIFISEEAVKSDLSNTGIYVYIVYIAYLPY